MYEYDMTRIGDRQRQYALNVFSALHTEGFITFEEWEKIIQKVPTIKTKKEMSNLCSAYQINPIKLPASEIKLPASEIKLPDDKPTKNSLLTDVWVWLSFIMPFVVTPLLAVVIWDESRFTPIGSIVIFIVIASWILLNAVINIKNFLFKDFEVAPY